MNVPKSWLTEFVNLKDISDTNFADRMTFAGNKVEAIHTTTQDTIFEFEITSNRPDTLSIIGIAREAAAVFDRSLILPLTPSLLKATAKPKDLKVISKNLCPTYSVVEITHASIKPVSRLISQRLKLAGINVINNIVDITNYLMLETGQPMHAFDADKIIGTPTLRAAKTGEIITPLDHKPRTLKGGEIIIQDEKKLIDLAGLMGGLNTEITSQTNHIWLIVPIYNPVAIRRASKHVGLRTDSSTRFEKKLDLTQTEVVTRRAVNLLIKETGGRLATSITTLTTTWRPPTIALDSAYIAKVIGKSMSQKTIDKYLNSLGIHQTPHGYQPPSWRRDLEQPIDLVEEIARLDGYNQLTKSLPSGVIPIHTDALTPNWSRLLKNKLVALGFIETYGSTLISKDTITNLGLLPQNHLKVLHPMSQDFQYMRTSIMESLIPTFIFNLKHTDDLNLFELGTVFHPNSKKSQLPKQPLELGIISTTLNFPQMKGVVEYLARHFNLPLAITPKNQTHQFFAQSAAIMLNKVQVGKIGIISFSKTSQPCALYLNFTACIPHLSATVRYPIIPTYPPIIEDLTFTLPPKTHLGPVITVIKTVSPLIEQVTLKDIFRANHTFTISYRSSEQSLTDQQIAPLRKLIVNALQKTFSAKLVGKI